MNRLVLSIFEFIATMLINVKVHSVRSLFFCFVQCIAMVDKYAKVAFDFLETWLVCVALLSMLLLTLLARMMSVFFTCFAVILHSLVVISGCVAVGFV